MVQLRRAGGRGASSAGQPFSEPAQCQYSGLPERAGADTGERDVRDVSLPDLPAAAHRLRHLPGLRLPAVVPQHHLDSHRRPVVVRSHLLLGLSHCHQRHWVFDWSPSTMRKDVPQEEANRVRPVPRAPHRGHRPGVHWCSCAHHRAGADLSNVRRRVVYGLVHPVRPRYDQEHLLPMPEGHREPGRVDENRSRCKVGCLLRDRMRTWGVDDVSPSFSFP